MLKLIKRFVCLLLTALIVFFAIALWSGGEKFRWFGEKTGGAIKDTGEKLGERADVIKRQKDKAAETIKKLTGGDEKAGDSDQGKQPGKKRKGASYEASKKDTDEPETGGGEEDGKDMTGNSQHTLWDRILEKIRALKKG